LEQLRAFASEAGGEPEAREIEIRRVFEPEELR